MIGLHSRERVTGWQRLVDDNRACRARARVDRASLRSGVCAQQPPAFRPVAARIAIEFPPQRRRCRRPGKSTARTARQQRARPDHLIKTNVQDHHAINPSTTTSRAWLDRLSADRRRRPLLCEVVPVLQPRVRGREPALHRQVHPDGHVGERAGGVVAGCASTTPSPTAKRSGRRWCSGCCSARRCRR